MPQNNPQTLLERMYQELSQADAAYRALLLEFEQRLRALDERIARARDVVAAAHT